MFNLCCKYDCMDIWHGKCPAKVNPYSRIKNRIQIYHLKQDVAVARRTKCLYTALTNSRYKNYQFDKRFLSLGKFKTSIHRRLFLLSMFDCGNYLRECRHCSTTVQDVVEHCLADCKGMVQSRKLLRMRFKLYNASEKEDFNDKLGVFQLALTKKCYLTVL